ncbi:MAG: ATP-dependent Clp protease ATP-binding subunit [Verrucomicrobia bacterium]|nr:ATP-dependent Clp protease ATP-binding subunit [Verrucomicrobiota bacterium]
MSVLTEEEIQKLGETSQKQSPQELAQRAFAYVHQHPQNTPPKEPKTDADWMHWIASEKKFQDAHKILPSYRNVLEVLEDEKASFIQGWTSWLEPVFALIYPHSPNSWGDFLSPLKSVLSPIQNSPRLAYTFLFNFFAPFATFLVWEGIYDYLPESIREVGEKYIEHKGKIAFVSFALLVLLYYKMKQERGILVNLTENFAQLHKSHQALDLIPSYAKGIEQLFQTIGTTLPGQSHSNILWFHPKGERGNFFGKIGEVLAEITATGRVDQFHSSSQRAHLQIVEFNVSQFLTEYRTPDAAYNGWHRTLSHLKNPNILIVFTQVEELLPYFRNPAGQDSAEKTLFHLINVALHKEKIRCLIELTEDTTVNDPSLRRLFTSISAPKVTPEDLKIFCKRLFAEPSVSTEMDTLFQRLTSILKETPIPPEQIIDALQSVLQSHALSWREQILKKEKAALLFAESLFETKDALPETVDAFLDKPGISGLLSKKELEDLLSRLKPVLQNTSADLPSELHFICHSWIQEIAEKIRLAEKNLDALQTMKDEELQKIWKQKRDQRPPSDALLKELLVLEHVLLPLYRKNLEDAKKPVSSPLHLIDETQKKLKRLLGHCTPEEKKRLALLTEQLETVIQGQDEAIDVLYRAILLWRQVPPLDGKPLVLFVAGTPGVGKSATATRLAYVLNFIYGLNPSAEKTTEHNIRRIQLNRNQQGGSLIGWDGVKSTIQLQLWARPESVIVFEEWDKMNEADKSSLLDLLDGSQNHLELPLEVSSQNGDYVDKSRAIFIITANIQNSSDLTEKNVTQSIIDSYSKKENAKPFISRIDQIIPFKAITVNAIDKIIDKQLSDYNEKGILHPDQNQSVKDLLKKQTTTADARELNRQIQSAIFTVLQQT